MQFTNIHSCWQADPSFALPLLLFVVLPIISRHGGRKVVFVDRNQSRTQYSFRIIVDVKVAVVAIDHFKREHTIIRNITLVG